MKNLIKKILREQVEEDLDGIPQVEDNAMYRIRVVLELMKERGVTWDDYLSDMKKVNREPDSGLNFKNILNDLLKIVGGGKGSNPDYGGAFEKTYWFAKVFQINGGINRNFKEGDIQLIKLPKYEMEVSYSEPVVDYRTGWGVVVAVESEDEAIDTFSDNVYNFIEDSESHEMDYGDTTDVESVIVQEVTWIKFLPKWVGL
tara:strand:+ start:996 stop:1598 length:603 start_codon:yes stop_codon:yes gene_type:complete